MEFSHLQTVPMHVLRNRLIMLHHFSDLFCKSLTLFGMQPKTNEPSSTPHEGAFEGFDQLRSLLVSSSKVREEIFAVVLVALSVRYTGCDKYNGLTNDNNIYGNFLIILFHTVSIFH